jgi:hypothetical protein
MTSTPARLELYRRRNLRRKNDPAYLEKKAESDRAYYDKHKDDRSFKSRRAANQKRYRNGDMRDHHAARWQVNRAVQSGKLTKEPCEVCGDPKVQAHHDDYSRPLDVRWLCAVHHREHHARATGEQP